MTQTDAIDAIDEARTATLRRVGRNLVNVQRIETMLKFLLKVNFSGPLREIEAHFIEHVERVSHKTLGALIPDLAEVVLVEGDAESSTEAVKEVWVSSSLKVPLDAEARAVWNQEWESLRRERNRLVHLMLASVDFNSPEQCRKLDLQLDTQNALFQEGISFLGPIVTAARAAIAEMASGEPRFDPPFPAALQK